MKRISITLVLFTLVQLSVVKGQAIPEIGKPCPDFALDFVTHYPKKQVTLKDFSGKWLILDFWSTYCTSCIKSFPKISELQKEFNGKVQFLLVGINDIRFNKNIQEVFERKRIKLGLDIAIAYDSVVARNWRFHVIPYVVIVDPLGIVRHITDGRDMTKEKIEGLLKGEAVSFHPTEIVRPKFDGNLVDIKKENLIYNSLFTKWNGEAQYHGYEVEQYVRILNNPKSEIKTFQFAMLPLNWLYSIAFFGGDSYRFIQDSLYGKIYPVPILEVKDATPFDNSYNVEFGKGMYNYSLHLPQKQITKENLLRYMQQDMERILGYKAFVEERNMPVWKLIAKPVVAEKLKTKGGIAKKIAIEENIYLGFTVRNVPVAYMNRILFTHLGEKEKDPFIDATGITGNVDFTIDADMSDIEEVRKALQKQGLDLVKGTKKMKVLVIRDPK